MFRGILEKLKLAEAEFEDIVENVVKQNRDLEDLSEELLGERMADDIMEQVIKQEVVAVLRKRIGEAFNGR